MTRNETRQQLKIKQEMTPPLKSVYKYKKTLKGRKKCSTEQKKSLTHTQDFYSKFECSETDHFKGILAFYIDFYLKFTKIDIKC